MKLQRMSFSFYSILILIFTLFFVGQSFARLGSDNKPKEDNLQSYPSPFYLESSSLISQIFTNPALTQKMNEKSGFTPLSQCELQLFNIANSFMEPNNSEVLLNMIMFSGKGVNELGNDKNCSASDVTHFRLLYIVYKRMDIYIGLCVPIDCDVDDLSVLLPLIYNVIQGLLPGLEEKDMRFLDPATENKIYWNYGAGFWITIIILGGIVIICLVATLIDLISFYKLVNIDLSYSLKQSEARQYTQFTSLITFFSLTRNFRKLADTRNEFGDPNLNVFCGFKFFFCLWTLLIDAYYSLLFSAIMDPYTFINDMQTFWMTFIANGVLIHDAFFFINGFLNTVHLSRVFMKKKNWNVSSFLIFYFHKYVRLLPIYLVIIVIQIFIAPIMSNSPIFWSAGPTVTACETKWYKNLLYVTNFFGETFYECIRWAWYSSCYFQFILVTPFLVVLFRWNKFLGLFTIVFLAVLSMAVQVFIMYHYELSPAMNVSLMITDPDANDYYYVKPYCRDVAWLVGMLLGFAYLSEKNKNDSTYSIPLFDKFTRALKKNRTVRYILYAVGVILMISMIILTYPATHYPEVFTQMLQSLYMAFERPLFVIGLIFIVYPMILGKNRILFWICGNVVFVAVGRLIYGVYLAHFFLYFYLEKAVYNGVYYHRFIVVDQAFGVTFMTYLASLLLTLFYELPFRHIEIKYLYSRIYGQHIEAHYSTFIPTPSEMDERDNLLKSSKKPTISYVEEEKTRQEEK